jgi:Cof subfamily protein (haloacid dehalogenase superfamily)
MTEKIVFLDIDGTLTVPGSSVPPDSALEAIEKARSNGHLVFLCTGRSYGMASPLLKYPFDGLIASAGGLVICGDDVIYDRPLTEAETKKTYDVLRRNDFFITIECRDRSYCDRGLGDLIKDMPEGNSEFERWRRAVNDQLDIGPIDEYGGEPVYKFDFMFTRDEQMDEPKRELSGIFDIVLQGDVYGVRNGELINLDYDKGRGVRKVCEHLGIPVSDTIGFGDSMNDIQMIETVGTGVCMENGAEELKRRSSLVCPPVDKDGLARGFRMTGLL